MSLSHLRLQGSLVLSPFGSVNLCKSESNAFILYISFDFMVPTVYVSMSYDICHLLFQAASVHWSVLMHGQR